MKLAFFHTGDLKTIPDTVIQVCRRL